MQEYASLKKLLEPNELVEINSGNLVFRLYHFCDQAKEPFFAQKSSDITNKNPYSAKVAMNMGEVLVNRGSLEVKK